MDLETREFEFDRTVMMGKVVTRHIHTIATLSPTALHIEKETKRIIRKKAEERLYSLIDITDMSTRISMSFWDLTFGLIFGVLGFFNLAYFLLCAVCLWCSYSKVIEITSASKGRFSIPYQGDKEACIRMITMCNERRKAILSNEDNR